MLGLTLGLFAGLVQVVGYVFYIKKARQHDIDPHPVTWLIFAFDTALLTFLEFVAGASVVLLVLPILCSMGAIYVALFLFQNGKLTWPQDTLDRYILSVGIAIAICYSTLFTLEYVGVIPASYTLFAAYAFLLLSNLNTFVAFTPIIKEVRVTPEAEHAGPWAVWSGAYFLLLLATFFEIGFRPEEILLYLYPLSSLFLHATVGILALDRNALKHLYTKQSTIAGTGVFTMTPHRKGQRVTKLLGEEKYFRSTTPEEAQSIETWYGLRENVWIDPGQTIFRFLNHSCDPNCALVDNRTIVARRHIAANEEITIDYSMSDADPNWELVCSCGAQNCRGIITAIQKLPGQVVEEHLPLIPSYFLSVYKSVNYLK